MNPFKYGQVVGDEDFCPRPNCLKQLRGFIESGQNLVLTGERRIGKTSLIWETASRLKNHSVIYIDLLEVKTSDDLCRRMIKALSRAESHETFFSRLLKGLAGLRPSLSLDPISGQPCISLDNRVTMKPDSIESIVDIIGERAEDGKILVVFDEFQDILNLKDSREALAMLRSRIQFQGEIPYVFAGSIRNRMNQVFFDPESPFFKSAQALEIGPLSKGSFSKFLKSKFEEGSRKTSPELIREVIKMFDSVPGDVQEFCCALWDCSSPGDEITRNLFDKAFSLVFARESKVYEALLVQISAQQFKCLAGLARLGGASPYSEEFLEKTGITHAGSVRVALLNLQKKKILFRKNDQFRFSNPYFRHWLIRKNY